MPDHVLDILGNYFVEQKLVERGWKFYEFVEEWERGYIQFEIK